ncbi:fasciclin domain-containing protein [Pontibacter korlensis]|uniref:fasciclin domain-containing protein n=1 Tax=Pontibacter korlensis TaxID=400092 RepID=UPI000696F44D|nr:fasciclin domain-containing protein [Pontibacter korlensis]
MKTIKVMAYALAICCSTALASCGTNEENANNEAQREAGTNLREEPGSRGTNQNTPGKQAREGELGNDPVDASMTGSRIGGNVMVPSKNIVENINANEKLQVLAAAVNQAEMVKTLNGSGPYTVFAPQSEAFKQMQNGGIEKMVEGGNSQQLTSLLQNHVVAGKLTAADLTDGATLKTLGGQQLSVTKKGNDILVNGAKVVEADGMSTNGVIHVVEKVLVKQQAQ